MTRHEFDEMVVSSGLTQVDQGMLSTVGIIQRKWPPIIPPAQLQRFRDPDVVGDWLESLGEPHPLAPRKNLSISKLAPQPKCALCGGVPTHIATYYDSMADVNHAEHSCDNCLVDVVKLTLTKVKLGVS